MDFVQIGRHIIRRDEIVGISDDTRVEGMPHVRITLRDGTSFPASISLQDAYAAMMQTWTEVTAPGDAQRSFLPGPAWLDGRMETKDKADKEETRAAE